MSELWIVFREIELQSIYRSNNLVAMELAIVLYIKKATQRGKNKRFRSSLSNEERCWIFINERRGRFLHCREKLDIFSYEITFEDVNELTSIIGNKFVLPHYIVSLVADGSCDGVYCDSNADCEESSDFPRQCICRIRWRGNGTTCEGEFKELMYHWRENVFTRNMQL